MVVFGDEMAQTREALKRPMARPAAMEAMGRVNQVMWFFSLREEARTEVSVWRWKASWRKRS